jgi:hypothetical protein
MNPVRKLGIVQLTAAALALGLVVAGCSKDDDSSSSSESSSATSSAAATSSATSAAPTPAATPNYESLLLKPEELPESPSGPWTGDTPKVTLDPAPPDVGQNYTSGTDSIGASVIVTPDVASAGVTLGGSLQGMSNQMTGTPVPVPSVTPDAMFTSGTSKDGKSAMASLVFSVDRAVGLLIFASAPGDLNPVPQEFVETVGTAQVKRIQEGLPSLK